MFRAGAVFRAPINGCDATFGAQFNGIAVTRMASAPTLLLMFWVLPVTLPAPASRSP